MKTTQNMYDLMQSALASSQDRAYWLIQTMLIELGFNWCTLHKKILNVIQTEHHEPTAAKKIWDLLGSQAHVVNIKLNCRADLITSQVKSHLVGKQLLDFGCGDGQVGAWLGNHGFVTAFHDVADYRKDKTGSFTCDWSDLGKLTFDSALAIAVFHHCDEPDLEIERLTKITRRLVVIESVIDDRIPWEFQALIDWIYNRGMHPGASIPVPGNFRTVAGWSETFRHHGFTVRHIEDFGIDLPIVPEHHVLFVLDREI